jgi:hypothetical protein
MATKAKRKPKATKAPKRSTEPISNARLLKLAAKRRPPQSWYDDQTDPTKPATLGH